MLWTALCILLITGTGADEQLKGLYINPQGTEIVYQILETPHISQLLLGEAGLIQLNVTYSKLEHEVEGSILGHHFRSQGDQLEIDTEVVLALMGSPVGRSLPEIGFKLHSDHGVFGHESHAAMALYKLGMVSHSHHDSMDRDKRSIFTSKIADDKKSEAVKDFPEDVQEACMGINKGCSSDLEYKNEPGFTTPACPDGAWKFGVNDIEKECWGLCGPQCICWKHVCGDCCAHNGCLRHDGYCEKSGSSKDCITLRGVLWDKGPSAC